MIEEEDLGLTFSDEDFDRRYSSEGVPAAAGPSRPVDPAAKPPAAQIVRSRNRSLDNLTRIGPPDSETHRKSAGTRLVLTFVVPGPGSFVKDRLGGPILDLDPFCVLKRAEDY